MGGEIDNGDNDLPGSCRLRLDTGVRIRRFLAVLIRDWRSGKVASEDVGRIAHSLRILFNMVEGDQVTRRLDDLERRIAELAGP